MSFGEYDERLSEIRFYPARLSTEAGSAKVKQLRIVDNNEIIREDTSDM